MTLHWLFIFTKTWQQIPFSLRMTKIVVLESAVLQKYSHPLDFFHTPVTNFKVFHWEIQMSICNLPRLVYSHWMLIFWLTFWLLCLYQFWTFRDINACLFFFHIWGKSVSDCKFMFKASWTYRDLDLGHFSVWVCFDLNSQCVQYWQLQRTAWTKYLKGCKLSIIKTFIRCIDIAVRWTKVTLNVHVCFTSLVDEKRKLMKNGGDRRNESIRKVWIDCNWSHHHNFQDDPC